MRKGIGEFNQIDADKYYIQAKRYKPSSTIPPEKIRALRGSFSNGKGIFITTAKVSKKSKDDAIKLDQQRLIIMIDGKDLVISCIENEIGFVFNPQFSKSAMNEFLNKNNLKIEMHSSINQIEIEKHISNNDIRARILPIPRVIFEQLDNKIDEYNVCFNKNYTCKLKINRDRKYFAGITKAYKKFGLISDDGTFNPKSVFWTLSDGKINIKIN